MPSDGSPLIDAGDPDIEDASEADQNGLSRIFNDVIDIGASEYQPIEEEDDDGGTIKKKSSSGSFTWFLAPLALLSLRRRKYS